MICTCNYSVIISLCNLGNIGLDNKVIIDVMICTCNYSVIISLCNLGNIGLDKVIIIIRGNKSKLNYIE